MTEFEHLQYVAMLNTALSDSFMNFVAIYLAVLAALYFAAERLPRLIVVALVLLFTLYVAINLGQQFSLLEQIELARLVQSEQFGSSLPALLQNDKPLMILGIPIVGLALRGHLSIWLAIGDDFCAISKTSISEMTMTPGRAMKQRCVPANFSNHQIQIGVIL